jgi:hypothetical protein
MVRLWIFGACGILSGLLITIAYLIGAILQPGYSSIRQAISELIAVGAPDKALLDVLILGFHALVIPFAYGLYLGVEKRKGAGIGPYLLAAAGVMGIILTLFFPCDPGCVPTTLPGTLHIFIAVPMGFLILFAILAFSFRFRERPTWAWYSTYSLATFITGIILAVITVVLAESSLVGLLERLLTAAYQQWYILLGIALIRRSG